MGAHLSDCQRRTIPVRAKAQPATVAVTGLVFEVCGVLYDDTCWRRWLFQLVSHIGLHSHYDRFFRVFDCDYLPDVRAGRRDYWDALRGFLESAGLSTAQVDEIEAAGHARRRHFEEQIRPLPGVRKTLESLRYLDVRLAAISNSPLTANELVERLERLRLLDAMPTVVSVMDLCLQDSSADCFDTLVDALEVPADRLAYVGCGGGELSAAGSAGLKTIAFNHAEQVDADVCLDQFDELLNAIELPSQRSLAG